MISTKNLSGSGKVPKTLQPGNQQIQINKIYLEKYPFEEGAYNLMLDCESPDLGPSFEGFMVDKENASLGIHKGQVGRVRASYWAYMDKTVGADERQISRDVEIAKFMGNLFEALGLKTWFEAQDGKYSTIEEFISGINEDQEFRGKFINTCLNGKEYETAGGYTNYDLFFGRFNKAGVPFENTDTVDSVSRVYTFDPSQHIVKKKVKSVDSFEPEAIPGIPSTPNLSEGAPKVPNGATDFSFGE